MAELSGKYECNGKAKSTPRADFAWEPKLGTAYQSAPGTTVELGIQTANQLARLILALTLLTLPSPSVTCMVG
jgi:hypothetical protein